MIGRPLNRVDGPLKVTGRATYSYEEWGVGQPLYGFIVGATIGRGQIASVDASHAERAPGVRRVFTYRNAPPQAAPDMSIPYGYVRSLPMLSSRVVQCCGQPIALVVATTLEQARAAAALVDVDYQASDGHYELARRLAHTYRPETVNTFFKTDTAIGDFDAGFATAPIQVDEVYTTPYVFAQPMEPHNALAVWDGDAVTVHVSAQTLAWAKARIVATFGLQPHQVRVISRYVGGGFGSKLGVHAETILAVMAARELRQPVKVAMTRQQMFDLVGHRPMAYQRLRLGAERDGRLSAFGHDAIEKASVGSDFLEQIAEGGRNLYAAPHRRSTHRGVVLDLPVAEDVRSPGEALGLLAIESSIDELAYALAIDPIELRISNEPATHPELGVPFGARRLVECMREGAERFGWDRRPKVPASVRDGRWLIGYGMAAAIRGHFQAATEVRVRFEADGTVVVQSDMTDIGTGTYTILTQVASEELAVPLDSVRVELGESEFPVSGGSGGSWGAANSCTALARACRALRAQVLAPLAEAEGSGDLAELVAKHHPDGVEATGRIPNFLDDPNYRTHSLSMHGAQFAEVGVDADTGEVRLRRMLGVFAAGRVFNPKTARSQLIGGMIWGVSAALHEEGMVDPRVGNFINRDLAQYLMPVHADIPAIEAILLDGFEPKANELGAMGVGELGIVGSGAAVANAVFNATGVRVRDFPITLEKLLPYLPTRR